MYTTVQYNERYRAKAKRRDAFGELVRFGSVRRIGRNEVIGSFAMGDCSGNVEAAGRSHWLQMMAQQRKPVAQWHSLRDRNEVPECLNVQYILYFVL